MHKKDKGLTKICIRKECMDTNPRIDIKGGVIGHRSHKVTSNLIARSAI